MYLVFAFNKYYPSGGWNDLKFIASSEQEIRDKVKLNIDDDFSPYSVYDINQDYWWDCYEVQIIRVSDWQDVTSEVLGE